jgi:predicted transcriptional regulator
MATEADARPEAKARPSVARLTVNLPWKVWEALRIMAEKSHISKTEALRRAISTEVFRSEVEGAGGHLLVEAKDGSLQRVVFPY